MVSIEYVATGEVSYQKIAVVVAIVILILAFVYKSLAIITYPQALQRLGEREGKSWGEMKKQFETDSLTVLNDVYQNYSKKGVPVLIPIFGPREEVIMPPRSLHWLCSQPDDVLSSLAAQVDAIQLDRSLGYKFAHDPWGGVLLKKNINSVVETLIALMNAALGPAIDDCFGKDTESWKELDLFPACRTIAGRAVLSFTLGDSPEGWRLCNDADFVQSCYNVLDGMIETASAMGAIRKIWRPFLGRWASRGMSAKIQDLSQRFEPLYRERLQIIKQQEQNPDMKVPRDLIQMMLQYAVQERSAEASSLDDMTKRLAVLNFGTMHQTVITLHNLILDVLDSDSEFQTLSVIDDEIKKVMDDDPQSMKWSKAKLVALTRTDSVARETLRVHTFLGRAVDRIVIAKDGLVTEDGMRLPPGAKVSVLAYQAQTDAEKFQNPLKYDPFRFSRPREAAADPFSGKAGLNNLAFAATSAEYLPFSHGRHACPGRFMVDFEFKMTLAYLVRKYHMEFPESYGGKRPPNFWFAGFGIPPLSAKIRVKRKRESL